MTIACGIAYGTAAKWRCNVKLKGCRDPLLEAGEACCAVGDNMGWRYMVIILGCMTLTVFFLRYFVFTFHESPKFLLSKGREQEAIDVLHKIAKFNRCAPPTLTVEHFQEIDASSSEISHEVGPLSHTRTVSSVLKGAVASFKHLNGLFYNKLQLFIFILLAVAYMVSAPPTSYFSKSNANGQGDYCEPIRSPEIN